MAPGHDYKLLPTVADDQVEKGQGGRERNITIEREEQAQQLQNDSRLAQPTPSAWKHVSLLAFVALLFWLSFSIHFPTRGAPIVHDTNRYSKEFRFRPAASPVHASPK
ncbi:hypothetical protein PLICRDRAFT_39264 [Plicaturopsis crispa FD-325 SS-3]|nr:hypothetical protein PLICRDRAFT_39264 [Plicaturopsis crispa FD-325 SS-3]